MAGAAEGTGCTKRHTRVMGRQHVDHGEIVAFAQDRVNLPKDKADEYRAQARRLRERLEGYLASTRTSR